MCVRSEVAANKNTYIDVLAMLASDKEAWIRFAVAGSPNTPLNALETLADDENLQVSEKAENVLKERLMKGKCGIER